ncbi:MAG: hypothetical protein NT067_05545 [Candidatus Diapherotrites archaeon]|nr:hypothetical protein [Candidatus Diapherotrites archaeon]
MKKQGKRTDRNTTFSRGVSPLISAVISMLISIVVVSIVLQIGVPYLNRLQDLGEIKNLESTLKEMDKTISIVSAEGTDSQRKISVSLAEDSMDVNGTSEMITVKKETDAQVMNPRTRQSQGNYFLGVSVEVDAYESTLNDVNVLVLENEHIYLAIKKLDSNTAMKARNLVQKVRFKDSSADLNALVDFYMDSHAGEDANIATAFTKSGYNQGWGEIKASIYGTGHSYNVHFRLESGSDFIRVWASDAVWS